jgi:hypothetical protein
LNAKRNTFPFQPAPYIKHIHYSRLVQTLLQIRTQVSPIPAHSPWNHSFPHTVENTTRTPYAERFCTNCVPPRHTWGPLTPGPLNQLGTETHLLLHCPPYIANSCSIVPYLNELLSSINFPKPKGKKGLQDNQMLKSIADPYPWAH